MIPATEAVEFLDAVVPRMRALGVDHFVWHGHVVMLGKAPHEAPPEVVRAPPRQTAAELAMAGPPTALTYETKT